MGKHEATFMKNESHVFVSRSYKINVDTSSEVTFLRQSNKMIANGHIRLIMRNVF